MANSMSLTLVDEAIGNQDAETEVWERNDIQFPRLLAEIFAAGALSHEGLQAVADSMDLSVDQVNELLQRADDEFTAIKLQIL